jgi:imidazolonepropionase-like amidohydrolase
MTAILLKTPKLIDIENKKILNDMEVLVEDGKIKEVGKLNSIDTKEAQKIEFEEGYLMPGLIDAHLHLMGGRSENYIEESLIVPDGLKIIRAANDAKALLDAGYTTVRDCGSSAAVHVREAIREGEAVGPRILTSVFILTQTFGHGDFHSIPEEWVDARTSGRGATLICDGVEECRKAARHAFREGADFIKICTTGGVMSQKDKPENTQFTVEEIRAIVEEASHVNSYVASHAQGTEGINNALKAGVKTIEHAIYPDEETVRLGKEKDAVFILTLTIAKTIAEVGEKAGYPKWAVEKAIEAMNDYIKNIRFLVSNGVKIVFGTVFMGSKLTRMGTNSRELVTLVKDAKLDPWLVLEAATINNAKACGLEGKIGNVKKGYFADLIVVKENPVEKIETLLDNNNITFVMKEGKVYKKL